MAKFRRDLTLPISVDALFAWHERTGAFDRLNPPWNPARIIARSGGPREGGRLTLRVPPGFTWELEHRDYRPNERFDDVQLRGPFRSWRHSHVFQATAAGALLSDRIEYEAPVRGLTEGLIGNRLERLFRFRHRTAAQDLLLHQEFSGKPPLRLLMTGGSGFIGSGVAAFLEAGGHSVHHLSRKTGWEPNRPPTPDPTLHFDALIHLAGENVASGRWTREKKEKIRASRTDTTRTLCQWLASLADPPKTLLCASATGFYGSRGEEELTEASSPGTGFLASVTQEWEQACEPARQRGIRVVNLRFGVVLSPNGGALGKMLIPFKLGLGGRIGSGAQFISWIALDDLLAVVLKALHDERIEGPVNVTSPFPVTNTEFADALASVLRRPAALPMPASACRLLFGEMAQEMLLAGARVVPRKLQSLGHEPIFPDLRGALLAMFGLL